MYIFGAELQARPGKAGAAGAVLTQIRDTVVNEIGHPGSAWVAVNGAPLGRYLLSTRLDNAAALVDLQMKLAQCEPYQTLVAENGDLWAGPTETHFGRALATAGEIGEQPKPFLSVTQASMAGGHLADAMAWSGKVLEHVHKVTGLSGIMANSEAGALFDIYWMVGADSVAEWDAASDALLADADYVGMLDEAGDLFIPGSARRMAFIQLP